MLYLEAVEAERRQLADLLLADPGARRMREYRNSARTMHDADDLGDVERWLGDERRLADADEAAERLVGGLRHAALHQCAGDVRPPDAAAAGCYLDGAEINVVAELVEPFDDFIGALIAELAGTHRRGDQLVVVVVDEQSEDVDFVPVKVGGKLDSRNDLEVELEGPRRGARRRNPVDDVVIGDGEGGEADAAGFFDELLRGQRAVGERRMGV